MVHPSVTTLLWLNIATPTDTARGFQKNVRSCHFSSADVKGWLSNHKLLKLERNYTTSKGRTALFSTPVSLGKARRSFSNHSVAFDTREAFPTFRIVLWNIPSYDKFSCHISLPLLSWFFWQHGIVFLPSTLNTLHKSIVFSQRTTKLARNQRESNLTMYLLQESMSESRPGYLPTEMDPDDVSSDFYIVETRYDDQFMLYGFCSSLSLSSSSSSYRMR